MPADAAVDSIGKRGETAGQEVLSCQFAPPPLTTRKEPMKADTQIPSPSLFVKQHSMVRGP
jgi:hypothetical protein